AVGEEDVDLDDVGIGHAAALQHLGDVLPDLLDLLVDAGLELALRIDADLARDVKQPRALGHLGAQAGLARDGYGLWIVKVHGHRYLPMGWQKDMRGRRG